jgi:UDP-glucose 6-dehydrogenase
LKEQDGIDVCYMPEFLRDRYWDTDCLTYPLLVGGDLDISMLSIQNNVIRCDNDLLEVVKMFSNNINVLKIVFANHFYDISQVVGCDYTKVVELWNQVRTEQSYLEANENLRGFDGKCLPKDLNFLIDTFKQLNIEQELFTSLKKDNAKWPKHIRKS